MSVGVGTVPATSGSTNTPNVLVSGSAAKYIASGEDCAKCAFTSPFFVGS